MLEVSEDISLAKILFLGKWCFICAEDRAPLGRPGCWGGGGGSWAGGQVGQSL